MDCQEYVRITSSFLYYCKVKLLCMNDEDRKYLESTERMGPSFKIFNRMVQILANVRKETDQLRIVLDTTLLEIPRPIQG